MRGSAQAEKEDRPGWAGTQEGKGVREGAGSFVRSRVKLLPEHLFTLEEETH